MRPDTSFPQPQDVFELNEVSLPRIGTQKVIFGPTRTLDTPQQPLQCSEHGSEGQDQTEVVGLHTSIPNHSFRSGFLGRRRSLGEASRCSCTVEDQCLRLKHLTSPVPSVPEPQVPVTSCDWSQVRHSVLPHPPALAFPSTLMDAEAHFFPLLVQISLKSQSSLWVPTPSPALLLSNLSDSIPSSLYTPDESLNYLDFGMERRELFIGEGTLGLIKYATSQLIQRETKANVLANRKTTNSCSSYIPDRSTGEFGFSSASLAGQLISWQNDPPFT